MESTASGPVQSPVLDGRHARSRRRRHAGHGGLLRPLWYHQIVLLLATDAPPIRREAWATLQEWAVCSSIFVVGRGVKAGLPGSMPRGTLNARSERAPGRTGRVVAEPLIFAPRPALPRWLCRSHSVVRPSPRSHISHIYGGNGDGSTEPQVASWRPCATVDVSAGAARALRRLQQHVLQVAEQWHGAGAQHSCVGRWGRISIDQIASVTQHPTLIRSVLGSNPTFTGLNVGFFRQSCAKRRSRRVAGRRPQRPSNESDTR